MSYFHSREAEAVKALAVKFESDSGLTVIVDRPLLPSEEFEMLNDRLKPPLILEILSLGFSTEQLRNDLAALDMLVEGSQGVIGVEFKLTPNPRESLPSFLETQLERQSRALAALTRIRQKQVARLILVTN